MGAISALQDSVLKATADRNVRNILLFYNKITFSSVDCFAVWIGIIERKDPFFWRML